jgi:hypothetical protein
MCMPGAVDKVQRLIDDAVSKGAQVLAGGRIGPANPSAAAAANGSATEQPPPAAAAANGSNGLPVTPTRLTRRSAAAMAAATADGSSSSSGGQFYPPTVIVGVAPDMDLYHEEVFGPVGHTIGSHFQVTCFHHTSGPIWLSPPSTAAQTVLALSMAVECV